RRHPFCSRSTLPSPQSSQSPTPSDTLSPPHLQIHRNRLVKNHLQDNRRQFGSIRAVSFPDGDRWRGLGQRRAVERRCLAFNAVETTAFEPDDAFTENVVKTSEQVKDF